MTSLKDMISCSLDSVQTTIAASASQSDAMALGGLRAFGFVIPDTWDAAALSFSASFDNGATWHRLADSSGTEVAPTVTAGQYLTVDPTLFAAIPLLRLHSGTASTPVAQTAARTITVILRSI